MKLLTPTREKIISTVIIYIGLLFGSISKIGYYWIFFPQRYFKGPHEVDVQMFSISSLSNFLILILGNAIEVLFVYMAVCIIIEKFSVKKHKIGG